MAQEKGMPGIEQRIFAVVAAVTVLSAVGTSRLIAADTPALQKKIEELNLVTGDEVLKAEFKLLLEDEKTGKELVAFAAKSLAKNPNALSYNAAKLLARLATKYRDVKSGEALYRAAIRHAVKLESPRKIVESYAGLIDLYYDNREYGKSAKVCRELLELQLGPNSPRVVLIPWQTRFGREVYVPATDFDALKQIKSSVHKLLIQAVAKDGQYDKALRLVDNLLRASNHWKVRQLRAWVLNEAGRYKEAAQEYQRVLKEVAADRELEKEQRDLYEEQFHYLLSNVYVSMGAIDKASEHLEWLIQRRPDNPTYYNDLGYIWADHGLHLEKAEKYIRKAIDLDRKQRAKNPQLRNRDNGAYLDSLGWVLFKQKRYKEAKEWLLKAVEDEDAQHIEIYDHLGDVHMALGEREAAIRAWQRGLEVAGDSRREQRIRRAVEMKLKKALGK